MPVFILDCANEYMDNMVRMKEKKDFIKFSALEGPLSAEKQNYRCFFGILEDIMNLILTNYITIVKV